MMSAEESPEKTPRADGGQHTAAPPTEGAVPAGDSERSEPAVAESVGTKPAAETDAEKTDTVQANVAKTDVAETGEADAVGTETAAAAAAETETAASPPSSASGESAGATSAETSSPPRRVRLNPTVGTEQAKPRPSLDVRAAASPAVSASAAPSATSAISPAGVPSGESPPADAPAASVPSEPSFPATESAAASATQKTEVRKAGARQTEETAATEEPVAPPPSSAPVEIPPALEELDADTTAEMEAQLAAALQNNTTTEGQDAVAAAATAETEEPSSARPETEEELEPGTHLTGRIQSIHGDDVFLDVGYRSPGIVQLRQFAAGKKPDIGVLIEVIVDRYDPEEGLILLNLPRGLRRPGGNWDALSAGQIVDCLVSKTNKGGLEVSVGNLRGFMPASQVDLGFVSDLESYVGQKLRARVAEVNPKKRRLILSRRAVLLAERQEKEAEMWQTLHVGQTHTGTVKSIKNYGAFVDLGGVDGFLHIGEISHTRIRHPSDVLSEGQEVQVQILKLDPEGKKISLGMKQLVEDPWKKAAAEYPADSTVKGRITRIADFGAFVELQPGVEGMVHISEIDHSRVRRVADVLQEGQEVEAKVLEVDPDRRRIGLSLKALKARPESRPEEQPAEEPKRPPRKRREPLKGGTSDTVARPGGLFGNPRDFG